MKTQRAKLKVSQRDSRHAEAFRDQELDVHEVYCSASLVESLHERTLKAADPKTWPQIAGFVNNGYRVYILTERDDDNFAHAVHQAGQLARALSKKWHEASGEGA